jgi:hypothetical protein
MEHRYPLVAGARGNSADANAAQHKICSVYRIFKGCGFTHAQAATIAFNSGPPERHHNSCALQVRIVQHDFIDAKMAR